MNASPNVVAQAEGSSLLAIEPSSASEARRHLRALASFARTRDRQFWVGIVALFVLIAWLYVGIATKLFTDWYELPDYSYGFVVPLFVGYLLIRQFDELSKMRFKAAWGGVMLSAGAMLLLLVGVLGADLFLSRVSFVVLFAGLISAFAGWRVLGHLKLVIFLLLLAIPLPALILNQITFPLQLLASQVASFMLGLMSIPVLREGNVIQLSSMKLEVAEACSGIRSLMSLFTLAIIFGYFQEKTPARRTLIALASIPIAVAANAIRIFGTGLCVQYWDPDKAQGFFHEFSGWVMFLISLCCLFGVHSAMQLSGKRKEAR